METASKLGREFGIQVTGKVIERNQKSQHANGRYRNPGFRIDPTQSFLTPPFTIEEETDGGEDLRMKFRYLDIRRNPSGKT